MTTAKVFSDVGLTVPESLKRAVDEALQARPADVQNATGDEIISPLLEAAEQVGQNPFDIYDNLKSLVASLPSEVGANLLSGVIIGRKTVIDQAAAGFILHPNSDVARAVSKALAACAARNPCLSLQIERLVRMRPWVPTSRQGDLDATIRAMRLNALPPVKSSLPKVIKCYVSVCDGSGTRSLFVTQRAGGKYQIVTVMMKVGGVADAMVLLELSKSEMDDIAQRIKT